MGRIDGLATGCVVTALLQPGGAVLALVTALPYRKFSTSIRSLPMLSYLVTRA